VRQRQHRRQRRKHLCLKLRLLQLLAVRGIRVEPNLFQQLNEPGVLGRDVAELVEGYRGGGAPALHGVDPINGEHQAVPGVVGNHGVVAAVLPQGVDNLVFEELPVPVGVQLLKHVLQVHRAGGSERTSILIKSNRLKRTRLTSNEPIPIWHKHSTDIKWTQSTRPTSNGPMSIYPRHNFGSS